MIDENTFADLFSLFQFGLQLFFGLWLVVSFFLGGSVRIVEWLFEEN